MSQLSDAVTGQGQHVKQKHFPDVLSQTLLLPDQAGRYALSPGKKSSHVEGPTRTSYLIKTPSDEVVAGCKRLHLHAKKFLLKH